MCGQTLAPEMLSVALSISYSSPRPQSWQKEHLLKQRAKWGLRNLAAKVPLSVRTYDSETLERHLSSLSSGSPPRGGHGTMSELLIFPGALAERQQAWWSSAQT